jgi:hypothetical protein
MLKVANDVPQKLLDIFNDIDFNKIDSNVRRESIAKINEYTLKFAPLKTANTKQNEKPEVKKISKDFDIELLGLINKIDWSQIANVNLTMGISFIKTFTNKLPRKAK